MKAQDGVRLVRVGDHVIEVVGRIKRIADGPKELPPPKQRKRQRFARSHVRIRRTGPQQQLVPSEEARLLASAHRGTQQSIDEVFKAYVGIINVIIHKYNNTATEDDVQDAYEIAVRIIRAADLSRGSLVVQFDLSIRTLMSDKRKIDRGIDALDHATAIE